MADLIRRVRVVVSSDGADKATDDINKFNAALTATDRASAGRGLSATKSFEGLRVSLDKAQKAMQDFERASARISRYTSQPGADLNAAAQTLAAARQRLQDAGSMRIAPAVDQSGLNGLLGAQTGVVKSARDSASAFEEQAAAVARLRAEINPLSVAQGRLNDELMSYKALAVAGAISTEELAAANALANSRFALTTRTLGDVSRGARLSAQGMNNLGFQLNDIAVMTASGQNPFVMLMQQGMQIGQIFGQEGIGTAGGALKAFGRGVLSFVTNPINLAVVGIAALAGGIAVAFKAMRGDVKSIDDLLKEHTALIGKIKEAWGEAAKGLDSYSKESRIVVQDRARFSAEQEQASLLKGAQALSYQLERIYKDPMGNVVRTTVDPKFSAFSAQINKFLADIAAKKVDVLDFQNAINGVGDDKTRAHLREMTDKLADLQRAMQQSAAATLLVSVNLHNAALSARDAEEASMRLLQLSQRQSLHNFGPSARQAQEESMGTTAPSRDSMNALDAQNEAIAQYLDGIRLQAEAVGKTDLQQKIDSDLRQANTLDINAQTDGTAAYIEQLDRQMDAQRKAVEQMDNLRDAAKGYLDIVSNDLISGKGKDIWKDLANQLGHQLISTGENSLIKGLLGDKGQSGGGLFGGALSKLFGVAGGGPLGSSPNNPMFVQDVAAAAGVGKAGDLLGAFTRPWKDGSVTSNPLGIGAGLSAPNPLASRPSILDLISRAEGTSGPNGYNTSLGFGKFLPGGREQNLTGMSLDQIAALQKGMLANPANDLNSSAIGRYQFTSGTLMDLRKEMHLTGNEAFDPAMQDKLAMQLIQDRGATPSTWAGLSKVDPTQIQAALDKSSQKIATGLDSAAKTVSQSAMSFAPQFNSGLDSILRSLGGGGGLSLSALAGIAGGSAGGGFAGLYAAGGSIPAGKWGIVGERHPETVWGPATVSPHAGGATHHNSFTFDAPQIIIQGNPDEHTLQMIDGKLAVNNARQKKEWERTFGTISRNYSDMRG